MFVQVAVPGSLKREQSKPVVETNSACTHYGLDEESFSQIIYLVKLHQVHIGNSNTELVRPILDFIQQCGVTGYELKSKLTFTRIKIDKFFLISFSQPFSKGFTKQTKKNPHFQGHSPMSKISKSFLVLFYNFDPFDHSP